MASSRDRPRSRHRAPDPAPDAPADDDELDSYLAALAPGSDPDATELTGRFGSAQVFALRLPALRIEQLRRIATERGVSPGALAVDWVVDRLDREDTPTGPLPAVDADPAPDAVTGGRSRLRGLRRLGRRCADSCPSRSPRPSVCSVRTERAERTDTCVG